MVVGDDDEVGLGPLGVVGQGRGAVDNGIYLDDAPVEVDFHTGMLNRSYLQRLAIFCLECIHNV